MIKQVNRELEASITVEASLVLPIFILAMYTFIFLIQVFMVVEYVDQGLLETARYFEKIGYVYDYINNYEGNDCDTNKDSSDKESKNISNFAQKQNILDNKDISNNKEKCNTSDLRQEIKENAISTALIERKFKESIDQAFINRSCVLNGTSGLHCMLSSYNEDTKFIEVVCSYKVHLPLGTVSINDFSIVQKIKVRVFVGSNRVKKDEGTNNKQDEDYVYITETGTVYHETAECSHIKLSIRKISGESIARSRNNFGAKYYPCEICKPDKCKEDNSLCSIYYITNNGDRYHNTINCSGLKRSIKRIKRSEVGNRQACKRCGNIN